MPAPLERLEQIIDASQVARRIELLLPVGVRPRQLSVRTLLTGMLLVAVDGRPAHLVRVHQALLALAADDRQRLGILAQWNTGPHLLTYRQVERTFTLVTRALSKDEPDGSPSQTLCGILDDLLEASITVLGEPRSSSYAVDWTDQETWSQPPPAHGGQSADREASWGHRRGNHPGQKDELFYGYYLQAVTTVNDEHGPPAPELVRRMLLTSCHQDPPAAIVPVLARMTAANITLTDVLADSGYAYRVPETWALPVRALGANLIQDLHPNDRGPNSTHMGATLANGRLYCPATPTTLLDIAPLPPAATPEQTATHDTLSSELARYKLSPITRHDPDGYHRVSCPASQGKLRCPHRPASMQLPHTRPQVLQPPEHPPVCCSQQTITVPPSVNAKTAQKHDYPSAQHRESYARRSAAERTYASVKDPATNNLGKGWCRITGLTGIALLTATVFIARNIRVADAFTARQTANERRATLGLPPKTRARRRTPLHDLAATAHAP